MPRHRSPFLAALSLLLAALITTAHAAPPAPGVITFEREALLGGYVWAKGEAAFACVADFDGDGRPDVAVAGAYGAYDITVFLNDADTLFQHVVQVPGGQDNEPLVAGDFDEDGHPDLVNGDHRFRGLGDGTFAAPETLAIPAPGWPSALLAGDLDHDGHLDLVTSYQPSQGASQQTDIGILWGHGDGTFEPFQVVASCPADWRLRLAADVTGDDRLDLLGSKSFDADTVTAFAALPGRAYAPEVIAAVGGSPYVMTVTDLDHDGFVDLVMGDRVHHGNGSCTFGPVPTLLPVGDLLRYDGYRAGAVATDLDGDGWQDLVLLGYDGMTVLRNLKAMTFARVASYATHGTSHYGPGGLAAADFDGDGATDVLSFPHQASLRPGGWGLNVVGLFLGHGDGTFVGTRVEHPVHGATRLDPRDLWAIRLRPDGITDLLISATDSLYLMRARGDLSFEDPQPLGIARVIRVLDLDLDGVEDLLARAGTRIVRRLGSPWSGLGPEVDVGEGAILAIGSIEGPSAPGLVTFDGAGALSYRPNDGLGGFGAPIALGVTLPWWGPTYCRGAIGDLDGDGLGDLVYAAKGAVNSRAAWDSLWVARSRGLAPMEPEKVVALEFEPYLDGLADVRLADLDRDGDLDLLLYHGGSYSMAAVQILLNDGAAHFSLGSFYSFGGDDYSGLTIADLDGDGVLDLATAFGVDNSGTLALLRGRGDGTFDRTDHIPDNDTGYGRMAAGHFDGDPRIDLALPAWWYDEVCVLHNISIPGEITPVTASLASASLVDGVAHVVWATSAAPGEVVVVQRAVDGGAWSEVARVLPDGDGRVRFDDTGVTPGHRHGYRVAFEDGGVLTPTAEVWLDAPTLAAPTLALVGAVPNPVAGELMVSFSLARRGPATLALFDVAGRRVASHDLSTLEPGAHRVRVATGRPLAPGLYVIRLVTPERTLTARAAVVR